MPFLYPDGNSSLWGFALLAVGFYSCFTLASWLAQPEFPLVGTHSKLEARLISNFRFYRDAEAILLEGYTTVRSCLSVREYRLIPVQFKDKIFQFTRTDTSMMVLPPKYVNEIRILPSAIASPTVAHAHNLMGGHTNMNIILRNNLHFRTLQLKLTPNLNSLTGPMQEELDFAIEKELPKCHGMYSCQFN